MVFLSKLRKEFDLNAKKIKWFNEIEYCNYHHQKGHNTNKCCNLRNKVQELINKGELKVYNYI